MDTDTNTSWNPSPGLRSGLSAGMWATLAVGIILTAEGAVGLLKSQGADWLVHGLGWLALIPAFLVARAYWELGRETHSHALAVSSGCLFGALLVLQVFDLISMEALGWYVQAALWVLLVLGIILVAYLPFALYGSLASSVLPEADKKRIIAGSAELQAGARVLAHYRKAGGWYPGSLQSVHEGAFEVAYDDGDRETVPAESVVAEKLVPVSDLAIGDRVFGRWAGGACYYLGEVIGRRQREAEIRYTDATEEWTELDVVRLAAAEKPVGSVVPQTTPPEQTEPAEAAGPSNKKAGTAIGAVLAFLGVVAVFLLKAVGKGAAKFAFRSVSNLMPAGSDWLDVVGLIVVGLLLLMMAGYFVWFAIAKILARSRLGGAGLLLGVTELLGFAGMLAAIIWYGMQLIAAVNQPGVLEEGTQHLEQQFAANLAPFGILCSVLWVALTVWLFWSVRSLPPDAPEPPRAP